MTKDEFEKIYLETKLQKINMYKATMPDLINTVEMVDYLDSIDFFTAPSSFKKHGAWNGGTVLYEEEYPDILFAVDGEVYQIGDKKAMVIGGAYSVDKEYRISMCLPWFADE